MQEGEVGFLRKVKRFFTQSLLDGTDRQTDESGADTGHTEDFMERILLFEEDQTIGKTDDCPAPTDGTDDGDEGVRIAEGQHIDVIGDDQKEGDKGDREETGRPREPGRTRRPRMTIVLHRPHNEHQNSLVDGIIHLHSIVVIAAHEVLIVQTGAGT